MFNLFLAEGLQKGVEVFRAKSGKPNTSRETLKAINWGIVEFHTLLKRANGFSVIVKSCINKLTPDHHSQQDRIARESWVDHCGNYLKDLRNLFKKQSVQPMCLCSCCLISKKIESHMLRQCSISLTVYQRPGSQGFDKED